ncbi:MAG: DUF1963 domain-containing protein [Candidatus Eremiobacteraeota bacterium]|nr:DUF1963 domain-containing protein [Candidatus Eremiobacteraeota bacterium]
MESGTKALLLVIVFITVLTGCQKVLPPPAGKGAVTQNLMKKLEKVKRTAWLPVVRAGDGDLTASKFSGIPCLLPGESWPRCRNCKKPLQLFVQLDYAGLPAGFRKEVKADRGILQLFYCTNTGAGCDYSETSWPSSKCTLVRIISPDKVEKPREAPPEGYFPAKIIVGWNEADDYPGWEELSGKGITLDAPDEKEYESLDTPKQGEKLGGWPFWVQGIEYPLCPKCGATMRYLFQVDSEKNIPFMFGDAGMGHITQCPVHTDVLSFRWACY